MNLTFHAQLRQLPGFLAAVLMLNASSMFAQTPTVSINYLGNNDYQFSTSTLNPEDMVFYRFGDGFDLSAVSTSANGQASVSRKFKNGQIKVTALVARKNGPIGIATNTGPTVACANCALPFTGLAVNEFVRIKGTSWSPFVDPASPSPLLDDKTVPVHTTPGSPWFLMAITLKAPGNNSYMTLNVPQNMTIEGAIVKDIHKTITIGPNPITVGDPNVSSFFHPNGNEFRVNMPTYTGVEFNIYLIVKSSTVLGTTSPFTAQAYYSNDAGAGAPSGVKLLTRQNPYDPNVLTGLEESTCRYSVEQPPLHYRVDFLNLGAGIADNVRVRVRLDPKVVDLNTVQLQNIESSEPLTWKLENHELSFFFEGINLAGLDQVPTPPMQEASGWVQFSVDPKDCLRISPNFTSNADVTFYNTQNNFEETQETNSIVQWLRDCVISEWCSDDFNHSAPGNFVKTGNWAIAFPSLLNDLLTIQITPAESTEAIQVQILDLSGKTVIRQSYTIEAAQYFETSIPVNDLTAGMYFVQITRGNQQQVQKVIKQ